ncbi:MAG: flagellar basal body L-ring protein FlgH [candidate division Zixibacteria bacterium]|nr:flagellar basal body L-ring protein FlgH [candidate division Zixibacteria bacterium]
MESPNPTKPAAQSLGLRFWLILLFFVISVSSVSADQFSQMRSASMYTDIKANEIGDVLTVLIVESSSAQNNVQTNTQKSSEFDLDAGPGFGSLDMIPLFGASGESENKSNNQGQTSRSGNLKARMTVQVVGKRENGDLVIEGSRVVGINNDKEMLTLTGVVRAEDVQTDNTIYSYQIADAQINYRGKGAASNGGKPGWIMRFLNWVF